MPNSSAKPTAVRPHAHRRNLRSLVGIGVVLVVVASCTARSSMLDGPASSSGTLPSIGATPTSTLEATIEPTPVITPVPTPTPLPTASSDGLIAACDGKPVPEADPYSGTIHPLVVAYYEDGVDKGWRLGGEEYNTDDWEINHKWLDDEWPGPIQLVVCLNPLKSVKVGSCGFYKRSGDGKIGAVVRYKWSETVRVVVASTGKTLQSKVVLGGTPTCSSSLDDPGGSPPWLIHGGKPSSDVIDAYATAVSTQTVK